MELAELTRPIANGMRQAREASDPSGGGAAG
jgi:hypothetical protein